MQSPRIVDTTQVMMPLPAIEAERVVLAGGELPLPPSVNNLYYTRLNETTGKLFRNKTATYENWIEMAGWEAKGWLPQGEALGSSFRWAIWVDCGELRASRDVDNVLKATQDLVASITGLGDNRCDWSAAYRSGNHDGSRVRVLVVIWE